MTHGVIIKKKFHKIKDSEKDSLKFTSGNFPLKLNQEDKRGSNILAARNCLGKHRLISLWLIL